MAAQEDQGQQMPDPTVLQDAVPHVMRASHEGKPVTKLMTPDKILNGYVKSPEDLREMLRKYHSNVISLFTNGTRGDRRHYVEWIRPALRFYCKRFNVPVPEWLVGHGPWEGLPEGEHHELFGLGPLVKREFRSWGDRQAEQQAAAEQEADQQQASPSPR